MTPPGNAGEVSGRPAHHLLAAGRLYPNAWREVDRLRGLRGDGLPDWPEWCYMPIAGTLAIVAEDARIDVADLGMLHPERVPDGARLAALAAWRMTQGVYRFDPAVYDAVRQTPVGGDVPHSVLMRLPEWCIYIETPGEAAVGVFAHLEHDVNHGTPELRLLLDVDGGSGAPMLLPLSVHLGNWSLPKAIARMLDTCSVNSLGIGGGAFSRAPATGIASSIEPIISLLLYVCSQAAEITGKGRPVNPAPVRTRRDGWKLFPAAGPKIWDVGVRLGSALRRAYAAEETGQLAPHAGPRPHIRRAHWHTVLSGPRLKDGAPVPSSERQAELRWMPPIGVNLDGPEQLVPVVRPVK